MIYKINGECCRRVVIVVNVMLINRQKFWSSCFNNIILYLVERVDVAQFYLCK